MILKLRAYKYWKLREWKCCGLLWQLLLSPKFPERLGFHPVCPMCGKTTTILKVGIVGSRSRNSLKDKELIKEVLLRQLKKGINIHLVSGGCYKGADKFAEELAEELGLGISIHYPDAPKDCERWEYAQACYDRNTLIANESQILIVLWDGISGGTKNTIDKMGDKPVVLL